MLLLPYMNKKKVINTFSTLWYSIYGYIIDFYRCFFQIQTQWPRCLSRVWWMISELQWRQSWLKKQTSCSINYRKCQTPRLKYSASSQEIWRTRLLRQKVVKEFQFLDTDSYEICSSLIKSLLSHCFYNFIQGRIVWSSTRYDNYTLHK